MHGGHRVCPETRIRHHPFFAEFLIIFLKNGVSRIFCGRQIFTYG